MSSASDRTPREETFGYTLRGRRYLNVSNRCNLRCRFCPRGRGEFQLRGYNLLLAREPDAQELVAAAGNPEHYEEIIYCGYGEPTMRLGAVLASARELHAEGARLRLNTNGLANQYFGLDVTPELGGLFDTISVSLNAQDAATYAWHCRPKRPGAFESMLDFVQRARDRVREVSLTAVRGVSGVDIDACRDLAHRLGVGFRERVLDEVG